jgi:hypothetical protein
VQSLIKISNLLVLTIGELENSASTQSWILTCILPFSFNSNIKSLKLITSFNVQLSS